MLRKEYKICDVMPIIKLIIDFLSEEIKYDLESHFTIMTLFVTIATVIFAVGGFRDILNGLIKGKEEINKKTKKWTKEEKEGLVGFARFSISQYKTAFKYMVDHFIYCIFLGLLGIGIGVFCYFHSDDKIFMGIFLIFIIIYFFLSVWIFKCALMVKRIYSLQNEMERKLAKLNKIIISVNKNAYASIFNMDEEKSV